MKQYSWIKLSTDFFDDPKILRLQTLPERDFLLVFWIKIVLLSLRRNDGLLLIDDMIPYSVSDFVVMFRKDDSSIRMALSIFEKLNMIAVKPSENGEIIGLRDFTGFTDVEGLEDMRRKNREKQAAFRARQKESLKALESNSKNEESTDSCDEVTGYAEVTNQTSEVSHEKVTAQNRKEEIRKEEKREEKENTSAANEKIRSPHDPTPNEKIPTIDFDFSTGDFSNITERHLQIWAKAYPAVDVQTEVHRMAAWILANPKNKKSNWARFITNWLTRAQDRARGPGNRTSEPKTFEQIRAERTQAAARQVLDEFYGPKPSGKGGSHGTISI